MFRAFSRYLGVAFVMALTLSIPAHAEDTMPEQNAAATAAQGTAEQKVAPVSASHAAAEQKAPPSAAQNAGNEQSGTPALAEDMTPEQKAAAAATRGTAAEQNVTPASAPDAAAEQQVTPSAAQDAGTGQSSAPARAKAAEADRHTAKPARSTEAAHFRGRVATVDPSSIVVQTSAGKTAHIGLTRDVTVISLSKGSFSTVDFGTYVGAVGVKLEEYSPIVRDSAVWLHKAFELRIIDEQLRGIAVGHKEWDLTPDCIIAHGWVDDLEVRVLSIKWGPTDYDETDMEIPRDVPILRMSLGDTSLLKPGAHVLVGAQKGRDGKYVAAFVFVGKNGIVPPM